jgi:hypothetical protein
MRQKMERLTLGWIIACQGYDCPRSMDNNSLLAYCYDIIGCDGLSSIFSGKVIGTSHHVNDENATRSRKGRGCIRGLFATP